MIAQMKTVFLAVQLPFSAEMLPFVVLLVRTIPDPFLSLFVRALMMTLNGKVPLFSSASVNNCSFSDYGYMRSDGFTGPCVRDSSFPLSPPPCLNGSVTESRGYRKVSGDVCVRGVETFFVPVTRPCCANDSKVPFSLLEWFAHLCVSCRPMSVSMCPWKIYLSII